LSVVLSLILGVYVDATNDLHKAKAAGAKAAPPASDPLWASFPPAAFKPFSTAAWVEYATHVSLVTLELGLIVASLLVPIFRREVGGSLFDEVQQDLSISLDKDYTITRIAYLLGYYGGLNIIKVAVMYLMVVVGPLSRTISELLVLVCPMRASMREKLWFFSTHASVFFAYEVLILAVPILGATFYPMTSDILTEGNFAPCRPLNQRWDSDKCFYIDAEPLAAYWVVCALVIVHIICGFNGSWTHKYVSWKLYPDENPAPSLHCGCQNWQCLQSMVRRAPPVLYVEPAPKATYSTAKAAPETAEA